MTHMQAGEVDTRNPHGDGYWLAYQNAKAMNDDELSKARGLVGQMLTDANIALRRAQGMDAGYADAQRERRSGLDQ